jgi:transcriptional regulator with XRE-family HTH domain
VLLKAATNPNVGSGPATDLGSTRCGADGAWSRKRRDDTIQVQDCARQGGECPWTKPLQPDPLRRIHSGSEVVLHQIRTGSRLGRSLKTARQNAGLTQAKLAGLVGCDVRTVYVAESGGGRADIYIRLAKNLHMEIAGRALPPGNSIGARLQTLRHRTKLSRRAVAGMGHVSPTTIAELERGQLGHLAVLERVADALGAGLVLVGSGRNATFFSMAAASSASDAWATPEDVLKSLYQVVGGPFCLDPCSARRGRGRVQARVHLDLADDGLSFEWQAAAVYMNPPYGRVIGDWTSKALSEVQSGRAKLVVGLVPARTDTRWWHSSVVGHADVWLLRGRLAFGDGENAAPFPSALVLWGGKPIHRIRMSGAFPEAWHIPAFSL